MWSSMSRLSSLSRSSIAFARHDERAVFLDVDEIHLDVLALDVHDGECLLPVGRPFRITGLAKVHKITNLDTMQNTPYTASRGL